MDTINEKTPLRTTNNDFVDDYHNKINGEEEEEEEDGDGFLLLHTRSASDTSYMLGSDDDDDDEALHENMHVAFDAAALQAGTAGLGDDDDDINSDRRARRHSRTESHGSVLDIALESIADVKDYVVETVEEVKETLIEGVGEMQDVMEEDISKPVQPREEGEHSQKLSALALAVLVFYKVSGGPFGCEPTVKAAGPFYALLGFALFPLLWCVPEALITAELGSAYPEPSGGMYKKSF